MIAVEALLSASPALLHHITSAEYVVSVYFQLFIRVFISVFAFFVQRSLSRLNLIR